MDPEKQTEKQAAGCPESVSIIGTGDFGRALAKPLVAAGMTVLLGSRHPDKRGATLIERDPALRHARVCSVEEAVTGSNIIFLALHPAAQQQLPHAFPMLQHKLLVDVSNVQASKTQQQQQLSNAEQLQQLFPQCRVVKAFNTVSAMSLSRGEGDVAVAGDDEAAVASVVALARRMGLRAVVRGKLDAARQLEARNVGLFHGWGTPLIVAGALLAAWLLYVVFYVHVIRGVPWRRLPLELSSKVLGVVAITLLALCYLPGSIAAFTQLSRGTKHTPFSPFLDRWLRMRKELGLLSLWLGCVHCVASLPQVSPAHHAAWFLDAQVTVPANHTHDILINLGAGGALTGLAQGVLAAGILALAFMAVLGVTSLPSVAASMSFPQWTFVHSGLGYVCLTLAALHVSLISCPHWPAASFPKLLLSLGFQSIPLPYLTLLLRLVLLLPCLSRPLARIRRGHERARDKAVPV